MIDSHRTRRVVQPVWLAMASALLLSTTAAPGLAQAVALEDACIALAGTSLQAESLGLPTGGASLQTAAMAQLDDGASFCQVNGAIHPVSEAPDINFQVNLPAEWNHRSVQFGGGGYNGTLVEATGHLGNTAPDLPTPLAQGYVTYGSDSGHQASSGLDGSFLVNAEALANFGGLQLKKTHDVAMHLVETLYGEAPQYRYFAGASQGGHEALTVAQRWPLDYEGVSVTYPAYNFTALQLSGNRNARALYAEGAKLSPADVDTLNSAVYGACDGLDGAEDGIVSNISACDAAFDVATLLCEGEKAEGCLSQPQIDALDVWNSTYELPITMQGGLQEYARWPIYHGGDLYGLWGMGAAETPSVPPAPVADAGLYVLADPLIRYAIAGNPEGFDSLTFEPEEYLSEISEVSYLTDANDPNLSAFRDHGGKMLLMHGTIDFAISPFSTVRYYQRMVEMFGQERVDEFARFYMVPGFGHGSGVFQLGWDPLGPLANWVENGEAPAELIGVDRAEATAGRTRPMCIYPTYPQYSGQGDMDDASAFTCTDPN